MLYRQQQQQQQEEEMYLVCVANCQPKVANLAVVLRIQKDIFRLDVQVKNMVLVQKLQPLSK